MDLCAARLALLHTPVKRVQVASELSGCLIQKEGNMEGDDDDLLMPVSGITKNYAGELQRAKSTLEVEKKIKQELTELGYSQAPSAVAPSNGSSSIMASPSLGKRTANHAQSAGAL